MLVIMLLLVSSLGVVGVVLGMVRAKMSVAEKLWGMLCLLPMVEIVAFHISPLSIFHQRPLF
jgi:cyanate permease